MTSPRLQWFIDRIGRRVFPENTKGIGVFISDKWIAIQLSDSGLKYFDTKEEAEQFKK